jgi:hypothetical protein
MNRITYLYAGGMKIWLTRAVAVLDCAASRRRRAVKIHFVHSEKVYLARNRLLLIDAAYYAST